MCWYCEGTVPYVGLFDAETKDNGYGDFNAMCHFTQLDLRMLTLMKRKNPRKNKCHLGLRRSVNVIGKIDLIANTWV